MSITIQARTDYSFLFSGLGRGAYNAANSNFLGQYASIKNGSYYKALKAYYAEDSNDTIKDLVGNRNPAKTDSKELAKIQTTADALKESADALLEKGSKSVFSMKDITVKDENGVETVQKGYDKEAIYKAVNSFVTDYNEVVKAAEDLKSGNIAGRVKNLLYSTTVNERLLGKVGITVNKDNTLSVDKEAFLKADMTTVKSLFGENGSYGYRISAQSSLVSFAADREAGRSNMYNFAGGYNTTFSSGNLFNSYF